MNQPIHLNKDFFGLTVPEGSVYKSGNGFQFTTKAWEEFEYLFPKKINLIGLAKDLTEDKWRDILPADEDNLYEVYDKLYDEPEHSRILATSSKIKSGQSLVRAKGMKPENCLIIQIQ